MITGGVASVVYGDPRFTRDIDLILELREADAVGFLNAFSPDDFYRPPLEALRKEIRRPRHGHFNIIHQNTALRADVYLLGDDPLHAWALERHLRDISAMIEISGERIERAEVERWAKSFELEEELREARTFKR